MSPKNFMKVKSMLTTEAEDPNNHILDRIDAYLELSQLNQHSNHDRAMYVSKARELIEEELQS